MRRSQLLILVTAVSLASIVILLAALTAAPVIAKPAESPLGAPAEAVGQQLELGEHLPAILPDDIPELYLLALQRGQDQPPELLASIQIDVNYAQDWIAGVTDAYASVMLTVTDNAGAPQETATIAADENGDFFISCDEWDSGECFDIGLGDNVRASVVGAATEINPVGTITGLLDTFADTITGTLNANWLSNPADVQCEIWEDTGPTIATSADPNGGSFVCNFGGVWDLQRGQIVALRYYDSEGDSVINLPPWPSAHVNYVHDWAQLTYELGRTIWMTLTDDLGAFKASVSGETNWEGGFEGPGFSSFNWWPPSPDIVPGDFVYFATDDGYSNVVEVGDISGSINVDSDEISGTVTAPFAISLTIDCAPWGAWDQGIDAQGKADIVYPDGVDIYSCIWNPSTEWDVVPGQQIGVTYFEPDGDAVTNGFIEPAPYLHIEKWADGEPAEGGNFLYHINFWNDGDSAAENVVITETLEGMSFLMDTSPYTVMTGTMPGGEYVVYDVTTVGAGEWVSFDVYAAVEAVEGEMITNTATIDTSSFDLGDPGEKTVSWQNQVIGNDTHLNVGKHAWTGDPAPGYNFVFAVNVCNNGNTASAGVILEDILHPDISLNGWFAQHPGWYELESDPGYLIVGNHSISGHSCSEVYLDVLLNPGIEPGAYLTNTATIAASNDLEGDDNEAFWDGYAGASHTNLTVEKSWHWGQLYPGGELTYGINYYNTGNVPVGPVSITDTLPVSTTLVRAMHNDLFGGYEFTPHIVTDEYIVWELSGLENGTGGDIEVTLAVAPDAIPGTVLENKAEITRLEGEDSHEDNESIWYEGLNPPGPNLRVQKWYNWEGDGRLNYQVQFENIGSETINDIWVTDTLPLDTNWDGLWDMSFDWSRWITFTESEGALLWNFSELYPGDSGWLYFGANVNEPVAPLRRYTNTVTITTPPSDVNPDDNVWKEVAYSGLEVERVEFWLDRDNTASMWGQAWPDSDVTVTTPYTQIVTYADPGCDGCWEAGFVGELYPGDVVTVTAADGILPVIATIPNPMEAEVDTDGNMVYGMIGGWFTRPVEIHGNWEDGFQEVMSDGSGGFNAAYLDIPKGVDGYIRFIDQVNFADVIYHRPFSALDLVFEINYGHDWIQGFYEPGHTVWITVTGSDGSTVKGQAELWTEYINWFDSTGFSTDWSGWQGERPDIQAGDWVFGAVDNGETNSVKVGDIDFAADYGADIVAGNLFAGWIVDPFVPLRCEITGHPDNPGIDQLVDPDGGSFECDFGFEGVDMAPGQTAAVNYADEDGDRIFNTYDSPRIWVDIGPFSGGDRYVSGNGAGSEAAVVVTVTTDVGVFEASAVTTSDPDGNWDTGEQLPEGTLQHWYEVLVEYASGYTDTLTIFPVVGEANPDTDVITVTAAGPEFFTINLEICGPGWCDWYWLGEIGTGGQIVVDMMNDFGFDVQYGQDFHAHLGVWNGHEVIYSWALLAPDLGIQKWHSGNYAQPGGVQVYGIQYQNDGNGPAEDLTIVDIFPSAYLSYAGDTSGVTPDVDPSGLITWHLDTLEPGDQRAFMVTFDVDPGAPEGPGEITENCVAISSSSPIDLNPGNEDACTGPVDLVSDEVEMSVGKGSNPGDPSPGQEFSYNIDICNNRGAAAGPVVLTDTLPAGVTLNEWWYNNWNDNFWNEIYMDGQLLILEAPGFPGDYCDQLTLQVFLDPGAEISTTIENLVEINVADDVDLDNNWQLHEAHVSPPRLDLGIQKQLNGGSLVPGGNVGFSIDWQNNGNVTTSIQITDTMPPGISYIGAWWAGHTPWPDEPLPDPTIIGNQLIWHLPETPVGHQLGFNTQFIIDAPDPVPELENCVTIAGDGPDDWPEDNNDCFSFPINPLGPNLSIEKWHGWNGDGQLQYDIRFSNIGSEMISNVWITDTLPDLTNWNGYWNLWFDWSRLIGDINAIDNQLMWNFSELYPGDQGQIQFQVDLEFPGQPLLWYTNTVEITVPPGDIDPDDNNYVDVAFSGPEIRWVDLNVYGNQIWGSVASEPFTITTQYEEAYFGAGDFNWNASWPFNPGDVVTLTAGAGQMPVVIQIPDPFDAEGSSLTDRVTGQVDHLDSEWLEVSLDGGPDLTAQTNGDGFFDVLFPDIPRAGTGEVRYRYLVDYTEVTLHRGWSSPDLILEVNYGHDWVQGQYEPGHTVWITVTNEDGSAIKGTAALETHDFGGWFGFNTDDGWTSAPPDIEPYDWVYGKVDNGFTSEVQIFAIDGFVDADNDQVMGTVFAPWYDGLVDLLDVACEPWGAWNEGMNDVQVKYSTAPPDGSAPFLCEWAGEWNIQPYQEVGIRVNDPDGDQVINVLAAEAVDMEIQKWHQGNYASPGSVVLYGIYYRNGGNTPAESVLITDTLPANTSYEQDTSGLPVTIGPGNVITWDVGTVDPEETGLIWVTLNVHPDTPTGEGMLEPNCVAIQTSTEPEFDPGNDTACSDPVDVWPDEVELSVSKWTVPYDPTPGQSFYYALEWCNNRGAAAGQVWMTDTLPVGAIYSHWQEEQEWQSFWQEVSFDGGELVLYAPSLPGNQCERVNIYMSLDPGVPEGTTLVNEVLLYAEGDVDPENNWFVDERDVSPPRLDLQINKNFNNGILVPDGWINYFIDYSNNGNIESGVIITETVPDGFTFSTAWWGGNQPDEGQPLPEPVHINGQVVWDLGAISPGENRWFHVEFLIDPDSGPGEFGNCVEIAGDGPDNTPENNISCETVNTFPSGPNVRVEKRADWSDEGRRIDYEIGFWNVGDVPLFDVVLTDTFPVGTLAANEPGNNYYYPISNVDMTGENKWGFVIEQIWPGDQGNIQFQVELENPEISGAFYTNTVEAEVIEGEVDESDNNYVTVSTTGPDLYVEKELVDGVLLPGEEVTFMLTFGNDRYGHEWWWNLQHPAVMTDTLPSGLEFVSAAIHYCGPDGPWCEATPDQDGNNLVWDLWPIAAGQSNEIALTVRITDTAEGDDIYTNWAEIQSSAPITDVEPYYHNNEDSADVVIALPEFNVSKIYDSSNVAGTTVTFTITVENTGSEPGTNVVLSDTLPAGLVYGGGDGSFDGTTVTWTFPEILEDGGTATGTFTASLPCSGTITNNDYAVVSSDEGVTSEPGETVEFDVLPPTIDVSLSHTPEPIVVGSMVYFTATGVTDGTALAYAWDFGDGEDGAGEFASHQFLSDGSFNIVLTGTDTCGNTGTGTESLTIDEPDLDASFDQSASAVPIHTTVYFTDTSTTNGPDIVAWEWDFGDGSAPDYTQNPSHLYSAFGTFDVTLVVTDAFGYSDARFMGDAVSTLAPVFEISKEYDSSMVAGTQVTYTLTFSNIGSLTGTGLVITDALPANVTWISGGNYDEGTGIISWTWPSLSPGSTADVQFVGQLGCSGQVVNDSYQVAISDQGSSSPMGSLVSFAIVDPAITASFIQSATEVRLGESVVFTSTSTTNGSAIVSWLWDFGDGNTSTLEMASHAYYEPGEYDVALTVADACGNSDTVTVTDAVTAGDYMVYLPVLIKP
ncbi:MAG TPA: PKD domain-containing protein [candidate division Zixibacteria bacterium]|nr:PKD domain-containing protein [candidate division Zixibacteria bacterium]